MKKKLLLAMLLMLAFTLAFAITASAKDVNLGITDINGQPIIVPTVDSDGDSLTWYYLTEKPTEGDYYTYTSGDSTRYLVSVKTKVAAYVTDETYRLAYSYPGLKAGVNGNIIAMNLTGVTHANGTGPKMLNFICESTSIAYAHFPASVETLLGQHGNSQKVLFYGCGSLVGVDFEPGSQIKSIPTFTFFDCKKLTNITLPENLTTVEYNAFARISYIDLYVPKSVTTFAQTPYANLTIHFTGTSEVESNPNWYYKPNDYVNHCDVYHNGAHKAGETVGYETNCLRCGALVHCENPEHNLSLEISYESYLKNGKKMVKCLDCNTEARECVALPLINVSGFSAPEKEGRRGITFGYTLNLDAIADYEKANTVVVGCGILLAGNENFENGSKVVDIALSSKYTAIDVKIDFGTEERYNAYDLILAGSITVTKEGSSKTEYFQPAFEADANSYTSTSYGTLFGICYNDVIGA